MTPPGTTSVRREPVDFTTGRTPTTKAIDMPAPAAFVDEPRDGTLHPLDINRLNRRISQARDGQVVTIESGEYRGTLEIHAGVTLRPDDGPVRIWSSSGPAVRIHGRGATLEGLDLLSRNGDAVVIKAGDRRRPNPGQSQPVVRLLGCTVDGGQSAVTLKTARVRLDVDGGTLLGNGGAAVSLPENGIANLRDVAIESRGEHGVGGGNGVRLGLDGVRITRCARAGIHLGERAAIWGDATPSTISDNLGSGVIVGPGADGNLRGARITGNGAFGIVDPDWGIITTGADLSGNAKGERPGPGLSGVSVASGGR